MSAPTSMPAGRSPADVPAASTPTGPQPAGRGATAAAVALGLAILVGIVLRFVDRSELWLDEALTVNIARLPLGDIPEALRHDGHPPLYYVLLHGWMELFGEGRGAARALSGLVSTATLWVGWVVARRLAGSRTAWATLVLLATSPYVIRYGAEVRMYSLVMLLVVVGVLAVDGALRRPSLLRLLPVAVISGLLLLTHYWSIWLLGATILVLLATAHWRARRPASPVDRAGTPSSLRRAALAVAAGGLLFLPWVPSFLHQLAHTGTPWADRVRPTAAVADTLLELGGKEVLDAHLVGTLLVVLVVLGVFGRTVDARRIELDLGTRGPVRAEAAVIVLTLAIGLAISFVQGGTFTGRYAAGVVPLLLLIAGAGAARIGHAAALWVIGLGLIGLSLGAAGYTAYEGGRTQAGEVAGAIVADGASADDLVVYCPDQLGPAVDRLLPDDLVGLAYPLLGEPELVDWEDYEERHAATDPAAVATEVQRRAGSDHRVYLVWQEDYRTLEGQCGALLQELSAALGAGAALVPADAEFYEPANLTRFP